MPGVSIFHDRPSKLDTGAIELISPIMGRGTAVNTHTDWQILTLLDRPRKIDRALNRRNGVLCKYEGKAFVLSNKRHLFGRDGPLDLPGLPDSIFKRGDVCAGLGGRASGEAKIKRMDVQF